MTMLHFKPNETTWHYNALISSTFKELYSTIKTPREPYAASVLTKITSKVTQICLDWSQSFKAV